MLADDGGGQIELLARQGVFSLLGVPAKGGEIDGGRNQRHDGGHPHDVHGALELH